MVKKKSPIEIMKHLPGTDCDKCGQDSCYGFALSLVERTTSIEECPELSKAGKKALEKMFAPAMKVVTFGAGEEMVNIGGEEVMFREDLAFFGITAIAVDVWDTMSEDELKKRIKQINELKVTRFKNIYGVDAIAIRSVSSEPAKFAEVVEKVAELSDLPLILCSFDAKVLEAGVKVDVVKEKKPLLYAATEDNWAEVLRIAREYKTAVAIFSPGDFNMLGSIAKAFSDAGINDLILDPGTFTKPGTFIHTFNDYIMLRRACVENEVKEVSYPVMAVPAMFHFSFEDKNEAAKYETFLANALITRGIGLLIMHSLQLWNFLPIAYLREGVFLHPLLEQVVEPGLYEINEPDEESPLLATANYTLTYGIVAGDIEKSKVKAYLLVIDTGGLSLDCAVPAGLFGEDSIPEAIEESGVKKKVKHRVLIIPEMARDVHKELQEALPDWKVVLGPREPSQVGIFLNKEWDKLISEA